MSTASNIKSKQVRHAVVDALKMLINTFESYCHKGKTPVNGLVMLAGSLASPTANLIPCYL